MTEFGGVVRALSDGNRRQILNALRDEEHVHPLSSDGDEGDRDTGIVRGADELGAVELVLTALEARRDALPDDYLPEEGQRC